MKTLLALQYWEGDKKRADATARMIADLEAEHREDVDLLISARFDSSIDVGLVKHVSRKFNVYTLRTTRRGIGWPAGCNDLWYNTIDHVRQSMACKKMPRYSGILTFEADCVPLVPDWLDRLIGDWETADTYVGGAAIPGSNGPHINGNAIFSGDAAFLDAVCKTKCPVNVGWDWYLAPMFQKWGWKDFVHMRSHWQRQTVAPEELQALIDARVYFLHGVKDTSAFDFCRKKYLTPRRKGEPLS